jgi:uncharacterized membrane protein
METTGKEKIFGGLGAIFVVLGFIPYIGWILGIAGVVLLFITFHNFSEIFGDKNIFSKFLIGFLVSLAGIIVSFIFGLSSFIPIFLTSEVRFDIGIVGIGLIFAFVIFYILTVISCNYYRHCFNLMANYTNINLFKFAGTFVFWGAVGLILFGIGGIAIVAGFILLALAFFSMPKSYVKP